MISIRDEMVGKIVDKYAPLAPDGFRRWAIAVGSEAFDAGQSQGDADLKAKCDAMGAAFNRLLTAATAAQKETHEQYTSNILYSAIVEANAFAAMESKEV